MDKEELKSRILENNKKRIEVEESLFDLRKEKNRLVFELSNIYGEKAYGLKIGDRIRVSKPRYQKPEISIIQITGFVIYVSYDELKDEHNKYPNIEGKRILKDGRLGIREETFYIYEDTIIEKVTE